MNFTCIFFGLVFTSAGCLFAKGYFLPYIKAWREMPQNEKDKINWILLCKNVGGIISLSGIIFLFKGLFKAFSLRWFSVSMAAWLILAGIDVINISKKSKYYNNCTAVAKTKRG